MADVVSTIAAFEGALKEDYLDVINSQLNFETVLESQIKIDSENVDGLEGVLSNEMTPNTSFGYADDNGILPDAAAPLFKKARVQLSRVYSSFVITGPLMRQSASKAGAWAPALQQLMENLVNSFKKTRNQFNYGDGSGAFAQIIAVPSATTMVLDRWNYLFEDARYLDSYTAKDESGTIAMNAKQISSSNRSTKTLTFGSAHGASVGNFVYLKGCRNNCQMGLMGIVDNGTYVSTFQGISRSAYPRYSGYVLTNNGEAKNLSEEWLQAAMAVARMQGITIDFWSCTPFALNDLISGLQMQRQFVNPMTKFVGGLRAVDIGNTKVTEDPDHPEGAAFGLNRKSLVYLHANAGGKVDWLQEPDARNILRQVVTSSGRKDAFEATLYEYRQLGCRRPNANIRLQDVAENPPTGY